MLDAALNGAWSLLTMIILPVAPIAYILWRGRKGQRPVTDMEFKAALAAMAVITFYAVMGWANGDNDRRALCGQLRHELASHHSESDDATERMPDHCFDSNGLAVEEEMFVR